MLPLKYTLEIIKMGSCQGFVDTKLSEFYESCSSN